MVQNHAALKVGEQGSHIHLPSTHTLEYICRRKGTQVLPDIKDSQLRKTEPTEQTDAALHGGHRHSHWG